MKAFIRTLLPVFLLFCIHVNGQGKKERIFICKSNLYEDEHTSDPKFNNLVDSACIKINQRKYEDGLRMLNEAFILDSSSTGIANEYFRGQRNKLMKFLAEEEAAKSEQASTEKADASTSPDVGAGNPEAPPAETKVEENVVTDNKAVSEKNEKVNVEPPVEMEPSRPSETEVKKTPPEDVPAPSPVVEESIKPAVSDPEPVATPVPAPAPAEPVGATPPAPVTLDENNAPSEMKTFTDEEKEEFHIKGEQKVKSLEGYIKQLTDKNTSQTVVDDVTETAVALFDSEERTVEVSSLNSPNKVKLKVRKYFQKLSMIPYENITIEWADFQYTSDFRLGVDGNYYGYIIFRQRFTAEQDQIIVYEDLTTKKIEVILKRYNKNIEGQAIANWDVFLGDISVEQTEKY